MYKHIKVPDNGEKISVNSDFTLNVPDKPIIPYIEGDGTGIDITPVMLKVVDEAVNAAYGAKRKIVWMEMYAGEKSCKVYGENVWLPDETLEAAKEFVVSIKGPLTTPVGGGIRSINVALRQQLDLYVCLRPIRYFRGVPSPLKQPEKTDMVIFRENSEDIYAGIEWQAESSEARKVIDFLTGEMGVKKIRFPKSSGIGVKPVSREGTERLVRKAIQYAIANKRQSVTLVHKGNIMKFTEGAFRDWGYELAQREFKAEMLDGGPWMKLPDGIVIKDVIADAFLQQIRDAQPQRRLRFGRAGSPGRRHRHCPGREYVRFDRYVRGDTRNRAEVCGQGLRQSRVTYPVCGNDAASHRVERSGRSDHQVDRGGNRRQGRYL